MFKSSKSLEHRRGLYETICERYPNRVPVIVERQARSSLPLIEKEKFLVPHDATVADFMVELRRHIILSASQNLSLFTKDPSGGEVLIPGTASLMISVYEQYKDTDGFLYITYTDLDTFGSS